MNNDTIKNTIRALEIEANLISNGQSNKKNYDRLKNVINEWFYLKTIPRAIDMISGCKFNIGSIVINTSTESVKDLIPKVQKKSLATLITRFNGNPPCTDPEKPPIASRNEYTVILIDRTNNILVEVVDMIEADIKYDYEIAPAVVLSADDKIIQTLCNRLKANINAKSSTTIQSIEFDATSKAALLKAFADKQIGEYNLLQFNNQIVDSSGEIQLRHTIDALSSKTKTNLGVPLSSILYAFNIDGTLDTNTRIYTITKFSTLKTPDPWKQIGGATIKIKLQVIIEKISGSVITGEVDVSTLSATSAAPVDPAAAAAAAAATATSTAGP
jgi:hypothetical protein